ncbi:MAG: hypothetical protein MHM6MM_001572 [Cercozoa sp. M6MM]
MSGLGGGLRAALSSADSASETRARPVTRQRSATLPYAIPIDQQPGYSQGRRKPPRTPRQHPSMPPAVGSSDPPGISMAPTPLTQQIERGEDTPPIVARSMTEHGGSHMPQSCPADALDTMAQSLRETRSRFLPTFAPLPEDEVDVADRMQSLSLGGDDTMRPASLTALSVIGSMQTRARALDHTPTKVSANTPPSTSTPTTRSPAQRTRLQSVRTIPEDDEEEDDTLFRPRRDSFDDDGVFNMDM